MHGFGLQVTDARRFSNVTMIRPALDRTAGATGDQAEFGHGRSASRSSGLTARVRPAQPSSGQVRLPTDRVHCAPVQTWVGACRPRAINDNSVRVPKVGLDLRRLALAMGMEEAFNPVEASLLDARLVFRR